MYKLNIVRHFRWRIWGQYLSPRRLTLQSNPPIYRWLIWVITLEDNSLVDDMKYKKICLFEKLSNLF